MLSLAAAAKPPRQFFAGAGVRVCRRGEVHAMRKGGPSARGVNGGRSEPLQASTYGCDCAQSGRKKLQGS